MSDSVDVNGTVTAIAWSPAVMLERLGGDDALVRQLVELFVAECPRMMTAMRDSVAAGNAEQIRRAAHAFKGSMGNFTEDAPTTTAFELEQFGRDGRLQQAATLLDRLEDELAVFVAALRRFEEGKS